MKLFVVALFACATTPSFASKEVRLPVEQAYSNPPSGIEISAIPGFGRKISVYDDIGLDVGIDSNRSSPHEGITFFVFRRVAGDSALWLDRVGRVISASDRFGKVAAAGSPFVFSRPGSSIDDGIGQIFSLSGKDQKSTGALVFANEDWFVAVRATSDVKSPEELRAWIIGVSASIRWPKDGPPERASLPVQPCHAPIAWSDDSKVVSPALGTILAQAAMSGKVEGEGSLRLTGQLKRGPWCWDSDLSSSHSIYRQINDSKAYLIAIQDAGRALRVAPAVIKIAEDKSPGFPHFVTYLDLDHVEGYGQLDRLPTPGDAMKTVHDRPLVFRATTWGEGSKIDINSDAIADKK